LDYLDDLLIVFVLGVKPTSLNTFEFLDNPVLDLFSGI